MKTFLTATLLLAMAGGVCSAQSDQSGSQSLADVARNNRHKKAALVVNEDTISSIGGTVSVVGAEPVQSENPLPGASANAAAQKSPAVAADNNTQAVQLKKQLDKEKEQLQGWQQSAKHYEELLSTETNEFRRDTYSQALANDKTNISMCKQKVDEVEAQLAKTQQTTATSQSTAGPSSASTQPSPSQK